MNELYKELKKYGRVKANEPLAKHTTFKIGGPAEFLVIVEEADRLADLLNFLNEEGTTWRIIGGGSNVLAPDEGLPGVTIKISGGGRVAVEGESIVADAGARFSDAVEAASQNGLTGLEWAVGIPGTIGGAIRGNAGAMGDNIGQSVAKVMVWKDGQAIEMPVAECGFGYRQSVFKKEGGVVLRVWLKLAKGERKEIAAKIQRILLARNGKLPTEPSAGSFFKNISLEQWPGQKDELPPDFIARKFVPAGWLIEQSGLKGERVNDAAVSEKHGNFIINLGQASQADVLSLVEKIKEKVYNKYGINLEEEVQIINP